MKIALIGPFPPYRGGISMFNFSLAKELQKHHEIYKISFSLQYPKFFFPGKSQKSSFKDNDSTELKKPQPALFIKNEIVYASTGMFLSIFFCFRPKFRL